MLKKSRLRKIAFLLALIFSINCFAINASAAEIDEITLTSTSDINLSLNEISIYGKEYLFNDINYDILNVTSILEGEKEIPRKVLLNVKNIQQLPELPAGCEITSTTIVLNYLGFNCTKLSLLDYMPIMKYADKNGRWASPWDVFVGNPKLTYYGAFAPVIKKTIENYFEKNNFSDYSVTDLTGSSLDDLYEEVANGNPVIVWATIGMKASRAGNSWYLQDGTKFTWPAGEHCLVLIGYDKDKNTVTLSDPYDRRGTVEYDRTLFEKRYKELYQQAVVIRKT